MPPRPLISDGKKITYDVPVTQFTIQSDAVARDLAGGAGATAASGDTPTGEHFNDPPAALGTILAAATTGALLAPDPETESIDVVENAKRQITDTLDGLPTKVRIREADQSLLLTRRLLLQSDGWIDFETTSEKRTHNSALDAAEAVYRVKINGDKLSTLDLASTSAAVFGMFSTIIDTAMEDCDSDDLVSVRIGQPHTLDNDIYVQPVRKRHYDLERAWARFERVLASKQHFRIDRHFTITVFKLKTSSTTVPNASTATLVVVPSINDVTASGRPKCDVVVDETSDDDSSSNDDCNPDGLDDKTFISVEPSDEPSCGIDGGVTSQSVDDLPMPSQNVADVTSTSNPKASAASTYMTLHGKRRPQVRTMTQPDYDDDSNGSSSDAESNGSDQDWYEEVGVARAVFGAPLLRNSVHRSINSCQSAFESDRPVYSARVNRLHQLNRAELHTLDEQLEKSFATNAKGHRRRVSNPIGNAPMLEDCQRLRYTVKAIHNDCIFRCVLVGATRHVTFAHATNLANNLRHADNAAQTDRNGVSEGAREMAASNIREFVKILRQLTTAMCAKRSVHEILEMSSTEADYRSFVQNIDEEMCRLGRLVFNAILRSEAFERQVELTLRAQQPQGHQAGDEGYRFGQVQNLTKRLYLQRLAALKDFSKGKECDLRCKTGVWRFAFRGMRTANFHVSLIEFDGQRKTTHWAPHAAASDVHVELLLSYGHVWLLTSGMDALLRKSPGYKNRCDACGEQMSKTSTVGHSCKLACNRCLRATCEGKDLRGSDAVTAAGKALRCCKTCQRTFIAGSCFNSHVDEPFAHGKTAPLCELLQLCKCGVRVDFSNKRAAKHVCGQSRCTTCGEIVNVNSEVEHLCWMTTINPSLLHNKKVREATPMVYDIETVRDVKGTMHPVTLIVGKCASDDTGPSIVNIFEGYDCVAQFVRYVMEELEHCCLIAHNAGRFDARFVVDELYQQGVECDSLDVPGMGVMQVCVKANRVRFIDSFRLSPTSLIEFFRSYASPDEVAKQSSKDFFPYKMLTVENYRLRHLPQPTLDDYEPDMQRSEKDSDNLGRFHKSTIEPLRSADVTFDLKRTLREYCIRDVLMLAMAFGGFRKICKDQGADPVCDSLTVASMAFRIWRTRFLRPKSVAICKEKIGKPTSKKAYLYFEHLRLTTPTVEHKGTAGTERQVEGYDRKFSLDGFDRSTGTAYEFLGCYYHGCEICFPNNRGAKQANLRKSFAELYEDVENRKRVILEKNVHVKRFVQVWEHDWDAALRDPANVDLRAFVDAAERSSPTGIVERECLFGGRTETIKAKHFYCRRDCGDNDCVTAHSDEKVVHVDVTSMYPFVSLKILPTGHGSRFNPTSVEDVFEIVDGAMKIRDVYKMSMMKCELLAPDQLFLPVLPMRRKDSRVCFALCTACVECSGIGSPGLCSHADDDRILRGTWCSPEIQLALDVGYIPKSVHQVKYWKPDEVSSDSMFDYIRHNFAENLQWSGIDPEFITSLRKEHPDITDEEIEARFISRVSQVTSDVWGSGKAISLRPGVKRDSARRAFAKLMLNSLWGKLAERTHRVLTAVFREPDEVTKLIDTGLYEILSTTLTYSHDAGGSSSAQIAAMKDGGASLRCGAPNSMQVRYQVKEKFSYPTGRTNINIACFITSYARVHLYNIARVCGDGLFYMDTDSVVIKQSCVSRLHSFMMDSWFLGQLKSETGDDLIVRFLSTGAKSYMYKTESGITERHFKGLRLTLEAQNQLTMEAVEELIDETKKGDDGDDVRKGISVRQLVMFRNNVHKGLITQYHTNKKLRWTHTKRWTPTGTDVSLPFGMKLLN